MLIRKPEGMCTISTDLGEKKVVLGFNTPEQAQAFRDQAVDRTIDTTSGGRPREKQTKLDFTSDERKSVVAQTIVESIQHLREHATTLYAWGHRESAAILSAHADQIENDINTYLSTMRAPKESNG